MPRNLRDDYRMYYAGSWIMREVESELQVCYVEEAFYDNHGFNPGDIYFQGTIYSLDSEGRVQAATKGGVFRGDQIIPFLPESGYYMIGKGVPYYLEFQIQNRSNRKGFENKGVVTTGGQQVRLGTVDVINMFLKPDFKGKVFSDIAIVKSRLLWRGNDIGSYHDGVLELDTAYGYLADYLGKQIETFKGRNGGL